MPSNHLILCCPFLLLPSNPPSIRVFSNESALQKKTKSKIWQRRGLPWYYSGKEFACQCRRRGFDPCSGKIPHATGQLSPRPTTRESLCVAKKTQCSRLLFSRSVVADPLRPHGLQHTRLPCPSPPPRSLLRLMSIESVMQSHPTISCLEKTLMLGRTEVQP